MEKYSRLLYIANKQFGERKRRCAPSFVPFALSDYGELSPQAADLLEWLVNQFKFNWLSQGPRPDGSKLADSVRCFRRKLRVNLQLAVAAGMGEMLQAAGQPWASAGAL